MPTWSTPPTFADTNVLSASDLNILSNDVEYLYGLALARNPPFAAFRLDDGQFKFADGNFYWVSRRRAQYLNIYVEHSTDKGWVDHMYVEIGINAGSADYTDDNVTFNVGSQTFSWINIDLDAVANSPSDGDWYVIDLQVYTHDATTHTGTLSTTGATYFEIQRMYELDTAES